MEGLIKLYIIALQDHNVIAWELIREAIYRGLVRRWL